MAEILFVDDNPEQVKGLRTQLPKDVFSSAAHPDDVTPKQLFRADLVLVDYRLDDWNERDNARGISLQPVDGLALAGILRSHSEQRKSPRPIAFGILSNHIAELARNLPPEYREHAIARNCNIEWAFEKNSNSADLASQLVSLAEAVEKLPHNWPVGSRISLEKKLAELLDIPNVDWRDRALSDVHRCHPPIHELSEWTHGIVFLRWLLLRILPYPTFLCGPRQFAARLRIEVGHFNKLAADKRFRNVFRSAEYTGILSSFVGPRWWRSGIESILWDATQNSSATVSSLHNFLRQKTKVAIKPVKSTSPVVCLDRDLREMDALADAKDAVRIVPDDWPSYSDDAWTTLDLARSEDNLKALVLQSDIDRVEAEG